MGKPVAEASNWEPDGVTLQVRFCEGGGTYRRSRDSRRYSPNHVYLLGFAAAWWQWHQL
jgi:hypothetical protein